MAEGTTLRERVHETRKTFSTITPEEAKRRLDAGSVLLIDVGEEWQLRERGTIPGARNILVALVQLKRASPRRARP